MSELLLRLVELERLSRKTRKAEEKERHQGGGTDPDVSVKKPSIRNLKKYLTVPMVCSALMACWIHDKVANSKVSS